MTYEQMVAWLILEGWEYYRDEGADHWANMIRAIKPLPDERFQCQMILHADGDSVYEPTARGDNFREYKLLATADAETIKIFFDLAQENQND